MKCSKRISPLNGLELDEEDRPISCPNCGANRQGPYCHECGQRYMKARLTAWELWWIFADRFLDWEEGVWRTFLKMSTSPGVVIRRYLGGRRKTYLNPFSYVLFCAGLFALGQFLLRRVAGITALPGLEKMQAWGSALGSAEDQFTLIAYGTVMVVALMAVAMRIMFDGQLLNSMEAVVTALYASGNVFLLSLLISIFTTAMWGSPIPEGSLTPTFVVLFPFCVGHAGLGLFDSWGMAFYTAMTPVLAATIGFSVFLVGSALVALAVKTAEGVAAGNVLPLVGGSIILLMVLGPAIAPFLLDMYG